MRRTLAFSLASIGLFACGDPNAGALFADIQYGTDCDESRGCTPAPNRDVCGINNGDPCPEVGGTANLSCIINEVEGSTRTLTFSASQGGDFRISVRQAIVPFSGGSAGGGSCTVTVTDGPNTFVGACGSGTPTPMQPCQISNVQFCDDLGNPTVRGNIFCQHLANQANPLQLIEVHAKGSGGMAIMSPGSFRLANCDGLMIEDGMPACTF
ncbi:MAG: hypothetical protein H6719_13935 [Sandaracinaceae bacterium]|nr:hypothetical protein [Sandaracinaceae bacterium]